METQALRISSLKADGADGVTTLGLITWVVYQFALKSVLRYACDVMEITLCFS